MGGGDKTRLRLGAKTIIETLIERLAPQAGPICISTNTPAADTPYPAIPDAPGAGPLAGLSAALAWAAAQNCTELLCVPGDTPFIPRDLAARLAPSPAVAVSGGRTHHLVCRLPVMCAPVLAAWLAQGHTRAGDFMRSIGARPVSFDDDAASDDPAQFLNINTPDDLAEALRHLPVLPCL
jgi:molybdopterin-guanine dinucleotide biosynthesis protein A